MGRMDESNMEFEWGYEAQVPVIWGEENAAVVHWPEGVDYKHSI